MGKKFSLLINCRSDKYDWRGTMLVTQDADPNSSKQLEFIKILPLHVKVCWTTRWICNVISISSWLIVLNVKTSQHDLHKNNRTAEIHWNYRFKDFTFNKITNYWMYPRISVYAHNATDAINLDKTTRTFFYSNYGDTYPSFEFVHHPDTVLTNLQTT